MTAVALKLSSFGFSIVSSDSLFSFTLGPLVSSNFSQVKTFTFTQFSRVRVPCMMIY